MSSSFRFTGKLGRELALWFLLALAAPVCLLSFLTIVSLQTRTDLAQRVASETQQAYIEKLESFFRQTFLPAYKTALREVLHHFPRDMRKKSPQEAARLYRQIFFPALGIQIPSLETEEELPFRLQYKNMLMNRKAWSIYEWLYAMRDKIGGSESDMVLEKMVERFGCILRLQDFAKNPQSVDYPLLVSECQTEFWPVLPEDREQGRQVVQQALESKEIWTDAVLRLRTLEGKAGYSEELARIQAMSQSQWPEWMSPEQSANMLRDLEGSDKGGVRFFRWMEKLDPFRISYFALNREKLSLSVKSSRVNIGPNSARDGYWLFSEEALPRLKGQTGWSSFDSAFRKVADFMIFGDLALDEEDMNFLVYLGLTLDMENRPYRTWQTNKGLYLFANDYEPVSFHPQRYLAGLEPQPGGIFVNYIALQRVEELFLDGVVSASRQAGRTSEEEFLATPFEAAGISFDLNGALPVVRQAWRELFRLASGQNAREKLQSEELGMTYLWPRLVAYLLGFVKDNPLLQRRSLQWQLHSYLATEPIVDLRGDRGVVSEASLANQRLNPGLQGSPRERLVSTIAEGGYGSVEYRYEVSGHGWLVLAQRSTLFRNRVLFLQLSEELATRELNYIRLILSGVLLLTLITTVLLGRILLKRVVGPIQKLTERVTSYQPGHDITPLEFRRQDEIASMSRSFDRMVSSINARVRETLAVQELNDKLLKGEGLSNIMASAVSRLMEATGAELGYFVFFEQQSREKVIARGFSWNRQLTEEEEQELFPTLRRLAGSLQSHQIQVFEKTHIPMLQEMKIIALPVEHQAENAEEQVSGVLLLGNVKDSPVDGESRLFVQGYLSQTVTVIAKAWLDKIRQDNVEGRDVQLGLLPQVSPELEGLEVAFSFDAARFLGGDFFDFLEYEEKHRLGMVISDVSGKGIGPSLFGTTCKAFLQALNDFEAAPGDLLCELNDLACEGKSNTLFATVFLAMVDAKTREVRFASAGHNKMFLYRRATKELVQLSAKGLPLGMFSPGIYLSDSIQAEVGDWLFLYTDGVTELEDPDLALYGMERLEEFLLKRLDHLSPQELIDELREELVQYREGVDPSDDITYIAAKFGDIPCETSSPS